MSEHAKEPAWIRACGDSSPHWMQGAWRDWHRGHGCNKDDGKPRTDAGWAEINAARGLPANWRPAEAAQGEALTQAQADRDDYREEMRRAQGSECALAGEVIRAEAEQAGLRAQVQALREEKMKLDAKFYGDIHKAKDGSRVADDEYVVFLAKDNAFAAMLPVYRNECVRLGCDTEQIAAVDAMIERAKAWREANPHRLKNPDAAGERLLYTDALLSSVSLPQLQEKKDDLARVDTPGNS